MKKRIISVLLAAVMLASCMIVPTSAAATQLPQAVKSSTAKTPTASQQAQLNTAFPGIVCYGDSLTQGITYTNVGQHYKSYVRYLGELVANNLVTGYDAINKTVNFGINGDKTANIVARSGAVQSELAVSMRLGAAAGSSAPISIRLSTTQALISWVSLVNACETAYGGVSGKTQPNMTIDGVSGRIGYANGKLSFIRDSAGAEKNWAVGTKVTYEFTDSYANYIPVIFMGYNDGPEWCVSNYNNYKTYIQSIINKYNTGRTQKKYVIIVPHFTDRCFLSDARYWGTAYSPTTLTQIKTFESNLIRDFGADHVVKLREFMVQYGLSECGLTATAEDTKRINAQAVPSSLMNSQEAILNAEGGRTCYTHFNDKGNELVARLIYQKLYDQGAFDDVIDILGLNIKKSNGTTAHTHSMTYTAAKAATCKATGNVAYYHCSTCGKYYTDMAGANEISSSSITTPLASHTFGKTYSSDSSGHWFTCTACDAKGTVNVHVNMTDATGKTYCVLCNYVSSTHAHSMTYTAAHAPSCKAEGNIEYWYCTSCQKYFTDANGNNEISLESTKTAKTSHTFGKTYASDESGHWFTCTVCTAKGQANVHIPNVAEATETTAKYCILCNYEIEPKKNSEPTVIRGDADGNGKINTQDVIYTINCIMFPNTYAKKQSMDYNNDGAENIKDAITLLASVLFPDLCKIV